MKFSISLLATIPLLVSASPMIFPRVPATLPKGTTRLALDEEAGLIVACDAMGVELGKVKPNEDAPKRRHASVELFPRVPAAVPKGTTRIALDEDAGLIVAFDSKGVELGKVKPNEDAPKKRQDKVVGACSALSSGDVQKLKGWSTLESQAKANWGDGGWNIITNPEQYLEYPANLCVSTETVQLVQSGEPDCKTNTQSTEGINVGTNGTVSLSSGQGTTFTATATVTREASLAAGMKASVKMAIPAVADVSGEISTELTVTNTQSEATESTSSNQQTQTVTVTSAAGNTCKLDFTTTSCSIHGTGEVKYLASGWVWFNYKSRTQGHYKWALSIEGILTNEPDRSTTLGFSSAISAETKSKYKTICE